MKRALGLSFLLDLWSPLRELAMDVSALMVADGVWPYQGREAKRRGMGKL